MQGRESLRMHPYIAIPLAACAICSAFAIALLMRDPADPGNRRAALLVSGAAWWAFCEVLWNLAPDVEEATRYFLLSTPGWCLLGPVAMHFFLEVGRIQAPRLRRRLPLLYAGGAACMVLTWATPWLIEDLVKTRWGWVMRVGPLFPLYYLFTIGCALTGFTLWLRATSRREAFGDRGWRVPIALAVLAPMVIASLSDAILPMLGIQWPRLGTASFAALALVVLWNNFRTGDFFASPAVFAREILQTLPDGVALVARNGRIRVLNGGLERLFGADAASIVGSPFERWVAGAQLEPGAEVADRECELRTAQGARLPIALLASPLRDQRGRPLGSVVVVRDLRELTSLRSRLVTSGRLAAVGQLAAGIAHEINNPIAFVRANLGLLREHWESAGKELRARGIEGALGGALAEGEEIIQESLEGIDRAAAIVRDVREFSHAGSVERELTDLNQLLDGVLRVAAPELRAGIRLEKDYGELPPISCAPQQLKQVFLNLVVNAIHAVEPGGRIRVATRASGGRVQACIEDDGCGVPQDLIERIFDPFFTTKPVGKGTGLGLSISYEIVRNHGGDITALPVAQGGTRFCVELPAAAAAPEPA
jgi:PAS domain S-box-containing protein